MVELGARALVTDADGPDKPWEAAADLAALLASGVQLDADKQAFIKIAQGTLLGGDTKAFQASDDDRLLYGLVPGTNVDDVVQINAQGFRGGDFTLEKPAGTYRIAVLGDSNGFGWWVAQEAVLASVLEKSLNAEGGRAMEVYNFSVPGYCPTQEAALLEDTVLDYAPDLVVVAFTTNDRSFGADGGLLRRYAGTGSYALDLMYFDYLARREAGGAPTVLHKGYGDIAALSEEHDFPVLVALIPPAPSSPSEMAFYREAGEVAMGLGLEVLDLADTFAGPEAATLFDDPVHLSAAGHALMAAALHDWISTRETALEPVTGAVRSEEDLRE